MKNDQIVFTPAAVLDLLSQIDELSGYELSLTEAQDGQMQLSVGDSLYNVHSEASVDVTVDEDVVDDVAEVNGETYEELAEEFEYYDDPDTIESGIVKQLVKTLLVGGLVRLTGKMLDSDKKNKK